MRILVTGSRTWNDVRTIRQQLSHHAGDCIRPTVVHGACPKGADALADGIATSWGWNIERVPAEWDEYGKRAGFIRNAVMVERGADVCLAFIHKGSAGASMTANLAEEKGIPTVRIAVD